MASFNLTAVLNVRGPKGIKPVVDRLRNAIQSVDGNLNFQINPAANRHVKELNTSLASLEARLRSINSLSTSVNKNLSGLGSTFSKAAQETQKQARSQAGTNAVLAKTAQGAAEAASEVEEFGRISGLAIRRFAGFTIATGVIFGFINAVREATSEAIKFERELAKVAQVSGVSLSGLKDLTNEIDRLAISFGVSSAELLTASRTLKQAGFTATETKNALEALAKSDLAPTFDNITTTTEGAIAVIRQFGLEASDLESVLGSINKVAGQFAVESGDIIAAIRRAGGVFSAAAGTAGTDEAKQSVREFIALFTSVRATTRETAESIAVGLRTIFSRLQRGTTIDTLSNLGIQLTDLEGQFIGPFKAVEALNKGLRQLKTTDPNFAAIVEELGGIRQIGKIIPAIKQFTAAQEALNVALAGEKSLTDDVVVAQETLQNAFVKTSERFLKLVRDVSQSSTFKTIAGSVLFLANSFITVADALRPLLPLFATITAIRGFSIARGFSKGFKRGASGANSDTVGEKVGGIFGGSGNDTALRSAINQNTAAVNQNTRAEAQGTNVERASSNAEVSLINALAGNTAALRLNASATQRLAALLSSRGVSFSLFGRSRRNQGGPIRRFARGGIVPGSSNSDTIDAKLTPGEAVLPKMAVKNLGSDTTNKLIRGDVSDVKLRDTESNRSFKASEIDDTIQKFHKGSVRGTISNINDDFKPSLTSRGRAPGNVGRKKQLLQQRVEFLSANIKKQQKELDSLMARLKNTQESRTRRFSESFLNFALGGIVPYTFKRQGLIRGGSVDQIREELRSGLEGQLALTTSSTGQVTRERGDSRDALLEKSTKELTTGQRQSRESIIGDINRSGRITGPKGEITFGAAFLRPTDFKSSLDGVIVKTRVGDASFSLEAGALKSGFSERVENSILSGTIDAIEVGAKELAAGIGGGAKPATIDAGFLKKFNIDQITGNIFEGVIASTGSKFENAGNQKDSANAPFDFPNGLGPSAQNFTNAALQTATTDAKGTSTTEAFQSIIDKVRNKFEKESSLIIGQNREFKEIEGVGGSVTKTQRERRGSSVTTLGAAAALINPRLAGFTQITSRNISSAKRILGKAKSDQQLSELSEGQLNQAGSFTKFRGSDPDTPQLRREFLESIARSEPKNKGGRIGFNTGGQVPVALTPGELVFEPDAVQQQGLRKLEMFNKSQDPNQLPKLAKGGSVSVVPGQGNTDSFFTSLPEGSFVINKKASEFAMENQKFNTGGMVQKFGGGGTARKRLASFGAGGRLQRQKFADGGDVSGLIARLNELERAIKKAEEAAVRQAQATGRSVDRLNQLSNVEIEAVRAEQAPLREQAASVRQEIAQAEKRAKQPTPTPLRGGGGNNVINIPVPPVTGPFAKNPPPINIDVSDLNRAQAEGAFDSQVRQFTQPQARPATQRGDFLRDPESVVATALAEPDVLALRGFDRTERRNTARSAPQIGAPGVEGFVSSIGGSANVDVSTAAKVYANVLKKTGSATQATAAAEKILAESASSVVNERKRQVQALRESTAAERANKPLARAKRGIQSVRETLAARPGESLGQRVTRVGRSAGILNDPNAPGTLFNRNDPLRRRLETGNGLASKVFRAGQSLRTGGIGPGGPGGPPRGPGRISSAIFGNVTSDANGVRQRQGGFLPGLGNKFTGLGFGLVANTVAGSAQALIGRGTPEKAGLGAGISGFTVGASTGALAGSAFGPIGAAIGGVVGGISGAAQGYTQAFNEVADEIRRNDVSKAIEEFDKTIEDLGNGLDLNNLNTALSKLADQVTKNADIENNISSSGILSEFGGISGAFKEAGLNAFDSFKETFGFDFEPPNLAEIFSSSNITDYLLKFADTIGKSAEAVDDFIRSLPVPGFLKGFLAGFTGVGVVAGVSRAQRTPEAEARRKAAADAKRQETAKNIAERNAPIAEAAIKQIEKSLKEGRISPEEVASGGLDPKVLSAVTSASVVAQKAIQDFAAGAIDSSEKTKILNEETKKILGPRVSEAKLQRDLAAGAKLASKSISLAIDRFNAIARATEIAAEAGDEFRSQISLISGELSDITAPKLSGRTDLLSQNEIKKIQGSITSFIGPGQASRELNQGIDETALLSRTIPRLAAQIASTSGVRGTTSAVAIKQAIEGIGIDSDSSLAQNIKGVLAPIIDKQTRQEGIANLEDEIENELTGISDKIRDELLKAGDAVLELQAKALNEFQKNANGYSQAIKDATDKLEQAAELGVNRNLQLKEALGEEVSLGDVFRNLVERVNIRTRRGGAGNIGARPDEIANEIKALRAQRVQLNKGRLQAAQRGDEGAFKVSVDALNANTRQQEALQSALDLLANDVSALTKVESELANLQRQKDEGRSLLEEVAAAAFDPKAAQQLNQKVLAATKLLAGRGAIAPGEIKLGSDFLKQLGAIQGNDKEVQSFLDERLIGILANRFGQDMANRFKNFAINRDDEENKLVNQFNVLSELQKNALKNQANLLRESAKAIEQAGIRIVGEVKNTAQQLINSRIPRIFADVRGNVQQTKQIQAGNIQAGSIQIQQRPRTPFGRKDGGIIKGFAHGGEVTGGPYIPGKDTIPAVLQDGEFVIRRNVVQKPGVKPLLSAMNNGGLVGLKEGGNTKDILKNKNYPTPEEYLKTLNNQAYLYNLNFRKNFSTPAQDRFDKIIESRREKKPSILTRAKNAIADTVKNFVRKKEQVDTANLAPPSSDTSLNSNSRVSDAIAASKAILRNEEKFGRPFSEQRLATDQSQSKSKPQDSPKAFPRTTYQGRDPKLVADAEKAIQDGKAAIARDAELRKRLDAIRNSGNINREAPVQAGRELRKITDETLARSNEQASDKNLRRKELLSYGLQLQSEVQAGTLTREKAFELLLQKGKGESALFGKYTNEDVQNVVDEIRLRRMIDEQNKITSVRNRRGEPIVKTGRFSITDLPEGISNVRTADGQPVIKTGRNIPEDGPVVGGATLSRAGRARRGNAIRRREAALGQREGVGFVPRDRRRPNLSNRTRINGRSTRLFGFPAGTARFLLKNIDKADRDLALSTAREWGLSEILSVMQILDKNFPGNDYSILDIEDAFNKSKFKTYTHPESGLEFRLPDRQRFDDFLKWGADNRKGIFGFKKGGSPKDSVLAMLQPGEFVVQAPIVSENPAFFEKLNAGKIPGFAHGGFVGNKIFDVNRPSDSIRTLPDRRVDVATPLDTRRTLPDRKVDINRTNGSMDKLAGAFDLFNTGSQQLASALQSFGNFASIATSLTRAAEGLKQVVIPDRIEIQVAPINVTATVSVAGADESVEKLKEGLEAFAAQKIKEAINRNINPITGETENNFLQ